MNQLFLFYRHKKTPIQIPQDWNLLTFAYLGDAQEVRDPVELAAKSLRNPVGAPRLTERLSPSDRIAVLVEDITRASPKRLILRALLEEIRRAQVPDDNVTVLIALGTHRPLTSKELDSTFGEDLLSRYSFLNHDCKARDLVSVGSLRTGREVKINRLAHEATFRIGVGSIFPHPMNGFGGGGKILFPGIADFNSILEHHFEYTLREGCELGRLEGNPFHEEVTEIARAAKLDYIVNTILDHTDGAYDVVAGDPVLAHLAGVKKCKSIISMEFPRKADLTVITSFPYTEGPQIVKPLSPAALVTKRGGCIILFADSTGELPDIFFQGFERFHAEQGGNLLGGVQDHFRGRRPIVEGAAVDLNMAAAMTLRSQHDFQVILVTEDIPGEKVEKMGFRYAQDARTAFEIAGSVVKPAPDVHVVPSGGIILPVLS